MKKLLKKIKNKIKIFKINNRIKKYKFVHIMFNDKFNKPFVDFLNRSFNPKEHLVLCKCFFNEFPFPEGENVVEIKSLKGLKFDSVEKIICHSLFDIELVDYLYNHREILKNKAYWVIWGGDLYGAPRDEKNNYVRRNFKGYISDVDGDCEIALKQYGSNPKTYNAGYTFPITKEMISNAKQVVAQYKTETPVIIQINNSCDDSTLAILDDLSRFKDENIKITTILSYGKLEYKEQIIQKGKEIFGNKFNYLDKILSPGEYAIHLANVDILILNQNRQQGLGNSMVALNMGAKLFIRSEITTFTHLNSKGCKVFDTNKIKDMTFDEFICLDEATKKLNEKNSEKFFSDLYLKSLWYSIFYDKEFNYWDDRAERFGKRSVYNMTHSVNELQTVDVIQRNIYGELLDKIISSKLDVAIDFGCGFGRFTGFLAENYAKKVYGIDATKKLIDIALPHEKVEYIHLTGNKIPLKDNSISLVFISLVLGGITNQDDLINVVAELRRVAKPSAAFLIAENTQKTPDSEYWHYRGADYYKKLFNFVDFVHETKYYDCGEEITVLLGTISW